MIIKHPRLIIKQHGIIKNYRYVGDVSVIRIPVNCGLASIINVLTLVAATYHVVGDYYKE